MTVRRDFCKDVARMWVAVYKALVESQDGEGLQKVAGQSCDIRTRRHSMDLRDLPTLDEVHRQHLSAAQPVHRPRNRHVDPFGLKGRHRSSRAVGLQREIDLFAGGAAPLADDGRHVGDLLMSLQRLLGDVLDTTQVHIHHLCDALVLDLDAHLLAGGPHNSPVRLTHGRRSQGFEVELLEDIGQGAAQVGAHDALDLLLRGNRQMVLQCPHLFAVGLRDAPIAGGEALPNLRQETFVLDDVSIRSLCIRAMKFLPSGVFCVLVGLRILFQIPLQGPHANMNPARQQERGQSTPEQRQTAGISSPFSLHRYTHAKQNFLSLERYT
mmetsp:Transcript_89672/g.287564  ORF Transcript_89672/g.287564 Transcript_89672/m.287564 type:complete len:325 (+) Transcript_89672:2802-3776(+)